MNEEEETQAIAGSDGLPHITIQRLNDICGPGPYQVRTVVQIKELDGSMSGPYLVVDSEPIGPKS